MRAPRLFALWLVLAIPALMGVVMVGFGSGAANPITAAITSNCSEKSSGVYGSPAFCHFSASTTTHSDTDIIPFIHLNYEWSFGDSGTSGTGNWSYGRGDAKNSAYGPEVAHVFECSSATCAYTITLTVTDYAGNSKVATSSLTVTGEDSAWTDANTYCYCYDTDTDGAGADTDTCDGTTKTVGFRGCPIDNNDDGDCNDIGEDSTHCLEAQDFDANASTTAGRRTLWRAGDTFAMDNGTTINIPNNSSDGTLWGCYGSAATTTCAAARPIVAYSPDSANIQSAGGVASANFRFKDLVFDASANATAADGNPRLFALESGSTSGHDILWLRTDLLDVAGCHNFGTQTHSPTFNYRIGIFDSKCRQVDVASGGWTFWSFERAGIVGNEFTANVNMGGTGTNNVLGFRHAGYVHIAENNNTWALTKTNGGAGPQMSFRGCDSGDYSPASGCINTGYLNWYANKWLDDGDGSLRSIVLTRTWNDSAGGSGTTSNVIFKDNYFAADDTSARGFANFYIALVLDGADNQLIDSNVFDFRGLGTAAGRAGGQTTAIQFDTECGSSCGDDTDVYVQQNTFLDYNTNAHNMQMIDGVPTSGSYCINNLSVDLAAANANSEDVCPASWTSEQGSYEGYGTGTSCPFYGTGNDCTLTAWSTSYGFATAGAELDVRGNNAGDSIDTEGYDFGGGGGASGWSFKDIERTARTSTGRSIGAYQE